MLLSNYQKIKAKPMTATELAETLKMSRPSAHNYKAISTNPILVKLINDGVITKFRVARELTNYKTEAEILAAIQDTKPRSKTTSIKNNVKGIKVSINLGNTNKPIVTKTIVETILNQDQFKKHALEFKSIKWNSTTECKKAFSKLINIMEKELGV